MPSVWTCFTRENFTWDFCKTLRLRIGAVIRLNEAIKTKDDAAVDHMLSINHMACCRAPALSVDLENYFCTYIKLQNRRGILLSPFYVKQIVGKRARQNIWPFKNSTPAVEWLMRIRSRLRDIKLRAEQKKEMDKLQAGSPSDVKSLKTHSNISKRNFRTLLMTQHA